MTKDKPDNKKEKASLFYELISVRVWRTLQSHHGQEKKKSMQNYGCKEIMIETDLFYERSKIFAQFPKTLFA